MRILLFLFLLLSSAVQGDMGKTVFSLNEKLEEIAQAPDEERPHIPIPSEKYEASVLKVFLSLLGLILLIALSFWLFRRLLNRGMRSANNSRAISILEKRTLSPKSILYLVEVEGKKILLAESHLEIRRLANWEDKLEEETSEHS